MIAYKIIIRDSIIFNLKGLKNLQLNINCLNKQGF